METKDKISAIFATQIGDGNMSNKAEKTCKPRSGEKQNDFISRCIKEQMDKGETQDKAKGMCYGIWRGEKAKQEARKTIFQSINLLAKCILNSFKK